MPQDAILVGAKELSTKELYTCSYTVVAFPFALKIIISGRCEKKKLIFYNR